MYKMCIGQDHGKTDAATRAGEERERFTEQFI